MMICVGVRRKTTGGSDSAYTHAADTDTRRPTYTSQHPHAYSTEWAKDGARSETFQNKGALTTACSRGDDGAVGRGVAAGVLTLLLLLAGETAGVAARGVAARGVAARGVATRGVTARGVTATGEADFETALERRVAGGMPVKFEPQLARVPSGVLLFRIAASKR